MFSLSAFKSIVISKKTLLHILATPNTFQLFNAAVCPHPPAEPLVRTFDLSPEAAVRKSFVQVIDLHFLESRCGPIG